MINNVFAVLAKFVHRIRQEAFNVWCFLCLYSLGAAYLIVELNRKWGFYSSVVHLDVNKDLPSNLNGYVCVVTGGSRGIGFHVTKTLLSKGCVVIVASSAKAGEPIERLKKKLLSEIGDSSGTLDVWHLDLSSMDSVLAFVDRFKKSELNLNILINNAGVMYAPFKLTKDGYESHFAINYMGHSLLILQLMSLAIETARKCGHPARIVNVSSSTHFVRQLRFNDLQGTQLYSPYHAYAQSKLAQIMFTYSLHELLKASNQSEYVTVNCLHPGVAKTELYEYVWWVNWFPMLPTLLFRSAKEGAETVLFAALSEKMQSVSGKYLEDCAIRHSSKYSYDTEKQNLLWQKTIEMLTPWLPGSAPIPLSK